jgi:hypothetical protein
VVNIPDVDAGCFPEACRVNIRNVDHAPRGVTTAKFS